jgi:DUF4097 and DUF4098 domain-containing protein YvlB
MPIFATPEPIDLTIEVPLGDIRVVAGDRADTVVEVRPADDQDREDVEAAEQTRVEYENGKLLVKTPKARGLGYIRSRRSVDVRIEVPTGSRVTGDTGMGDLRLTGVLGQCRLKSGVGHVEVERTGSLHLHTATGNVTVDAVDGDAEISTGSGALRIGEVGGAAVVKNSNGHTTIAKVGGDLRMRASNGDISVAAASAGVDVKTANGAIRIGEVLRGAVVLKTSMGDIEVGIADGTAAWLDVSTSSGRLRNSLDEAPARPDRTDTVEVRAQTSFGDISIHRS